SGKLQQIESASAGQGSLASIQDVLQSQVIRDLREKHARAAGRLAEASSRYGARHPEVVDAQAQERDARRAIDAEIQRIANGARHEHALASAQVTSLEKQLEQ